MFNLNLIWPDVSIDPYSLFFLIVISVLIANHTVMSNYKMKELKGEWNIVGHTMLVLFHWVVGVVVAGIVFFLMLVFADLYRRF